MKIFKKIKDFFSGKRFVEKHAHSIVIALQELKKIINMPAVGFITRLTSTPIDDAVLAVLQANIPKAILAVEAVEDISACMKKDGKERLDCLLLQVSVLSKTDKGKYLSELGTKALLDKMGKYGIELSEAEAKELIENVYQSVKNQKN